MLQLLLVYAHVLAVVFLVGFALFGLILSLGDTPDELRQRAYNAAWPPEGLPTPVRVQVRGLGWLALAASLLTGALLFADAIQRGAPLASGFAIKFALIAAAAAVQLALTVRPRRGLLRVFFLLVLATVAIAATLSR